MLTLARQLAAERDVRNVEFVLGEPAAELGIADRSIDLFVCRRGPVIGNWLPLALRVAKPGAYAIGMHPTGAAGAVPDWNDELPEPLRIERVFGYDEVREWVTAGLTGTPATLHSSWWVGFAHAKRVTAVGRGRRLATPARTLSAVVARRCALLSVASRLPRPTASLVKAHGHLVELRHARLVWRVDLGIE